MILGAPFLRNVYSLFNFGTLTRANDNAPFMQFLSVSYLSPVANLSIYICVSFQTTDAAKASEEFEQLNNARLDVVNALKAKNTPKPRNLV